MITISQIDVTVGRPDKNLPKLLKDIKTAQEKGSDLHIATELVIPGYLVGDEWENEAFVRECEGMNQEVIDATKGSAMTVIWGNIMTDENKVNEDGRIRKYNAAFVARNGLLVPNGVSDGHIIKTLMPNYREFEDKRHFTSLKDVAFEEGANLETIGEYFQPFEMIIAGIKRRVGLVICEDMWDDDYPIKPIELLKKNGADMIVNISASPFGIGKQNKRDRLLSRQSEGTEMIYVNNVGAQNNSKNLYIFDGASPVYRDGEKIYQAPSFEEGVFEVAVGRIEEKGISLQKVESPEKGPHGLDKSFAGSGGVGNLNENRALERTVRNSTESEERRIGVQSSHFAEIPEMEKVENALVYGIQQYMRSSRQKKLVIGLSGGVDSALVAMLAVRAIGAENIIAVNMPSVYNSDTTKDLAQDLAQELGIEYCIIPIQESVDYTKGQIQDILGIKVEGLMEENIQARDRGSRVLMAVSAQPGCLLTNNGNKLEMATGYASIAGDLDGAIAPIADLYKTQIFSLSRQMAKEYDIPTLAKICDIPPSAELSKDQAVEEGKGDPFFFPYHDRLMYQFLEMRKDPKDILEAYETRKLEELLNSWTYGLESEYDLEKPIIGENGYFPTVEAWIADVERIWKLFRGPSTIKGKYTPTILSVSRRALGYDLRRSETGVYFTRGYERVKGRLLGR